MRYALLLVAASYCARASADAPEDLELPGSVGEPTTESSSADEPAAEDPHAPVPVPDAWTGRSAIPLARGDGVVALLSESRFGVGHDLQLGTHVAGLLAPHVAAMLRFARGDRFHASARAGLGTPTPLYSLLTGVGTFALLPVDRQPARALLLDLSARVSVDLGRRQWLTLEGALVTGIPLGDRDATVLDFPFLYPRFAPSGGHPNVRFAATLEGAFATRFRWVFGLEHTFITEVSRGYAFEQRGGLAWFGRRRFGLELGGRSSLARYPVGVRFHVTPYADFQIRF